MGATHVRGSRLPEACCGKGVFVTGAVADGPGAHRVVGVIDRYLTRQILLASVVVVAVFSGPVIAVSLISHLGEQALYTSLAWPALASIGPMILYHVLPALVAVAIVWSYGRFASEGVLLTIFSSGRSTFAARAPGLAVAAAAVVLGYVLTCVVIPLTAGHLHDVLFSLRRGVNPALLKPGLFNQFNHGRQVIYFRNFVGDSELAEVFIRDLAADSEERVFQARYAVFERQGEDSGMVLLDGTVQSFRSGQSQPRVVAYDRMFVPLSEYGASSLKRDYTIIDEVPTLRFLEQRTTALADPEERREWIHEATNRFAIPLLALLHTWLGLELLPVWRSLGARRGHRAPLVCILIVVLHFVIVFSIEQTLSDLRMIGAFAVLVTAELAAAVILALVRAGALDRSAGAGAALETIRQDAPQLLGWLGAPAPDAMAGACEIEGHRGAGGALDRLQKSVAWSPRSG